MDVLEALDKIIDGLDDITEYEDAIDILRNKLNASGEDENYNYKEKYEELKEKYKKRFKEDIRENMEREYKEEIKDTAVEEKIEVKDLDMSFDGSSE